MTVCIAARGGNVIVVASDRLLTAGDIQFEPLRQKIVAVTKSIVILTAGDASFLTLVLPRVLGAAFADMKHEPNEWVLVRNVVNYYVQFFQEERLRMAEAAILAPLGLTRETFLTRQQTMDSDLVRRLAAGLMDYQVPDCAVIVAGRDPDGTHIYSVDGSVVSAYDDVGFAAIGMGARHANSQFMLARHAWHGSISDTLLLTYMAKRRSEAAPGVGTDTDMMIIGPDLGDGVFVGDEVKDRLREEYEKIVAAEAGNVASAKAEIAQYVQDLTSAAPTLASDQADQPEAESPDDDKAAEWEAAKAAGTKPD